MYLFEIQNTIDVTKRLIGLKLIYDENIHGKDRTLFPTNAAKSNVFNAVFKTNFVMVRADRSLFARRIANQANYIRNFLREFRQFQRDSNNFVGASYELV